MAPQAKKATASASKVKAAAGTAAKAVKAPRTKKQKAASLKWAAAGRAAQASAKKATAAAKTPAPRKAAKAGLQLNLDLPGEVQSKTGFSLHLLPACGPAALAEHLRAFTGSTVPDAEIAAWHELVQPCPIGDLLEYAAVEGFSGHRLKIFQRCDAELALPGMLCGLQLPQGYHAVLAHPAGMLTWGMVMSWPGAPAEAWYLEWDSA